MTPTPEHIAISKSNGIKIDWDDAHHSDYPLVYLRKQCPCATCTGAHGREPQPYEEPAPNPFQMFAPRLKMDTIDSVGSYAIRIGWSDGHNTGLYSYDHLRKICPCDSCMAK